MALTDKKRRFAAALRGGATNKAAAIEAGYSEKTAAQAGSRLAKDPDVLAELARREEINRSVQSASQTAKKEGKPVDVAGLSKLYSDPQDFLRAVMNDPGTEPKLRVDAAKTLMPYEHGKVGDKGKKDAAKESAEKAAGGKFGAPPPPRHLRAVGGSSQS